MEVSSLVQAKTRTDSSFDLIPVPTLSALDKLFPVQDTQDICS